MKTASHKALLAGTAIAMVLAMPSFALALGGGGGGGAGAGGGIGAHGGGMGASGGIHAGAHGSLGLEAGPRGADRIGSVPDVSTGSHAGGTPHLDSHDGLDRAIARQIGSDGTGGGKAQSAEAVDKQLARDIAKFDQEQGLKTRSTDLGQPGTAAGTTAGTEAGASNADPNAGNHNPNGSNNGQNAANNANNPNNPNNPNSPAAQQQLLLEQEQLGANAGTPPTAAGAAPGPGTNQPTTSPFSSVAPAPEASTTTSPGATIGSQGTEGSPEQLSGTLGATNETALRNFFMSNRPEGPSIPLSSGGINLTIGAQAPDGVALAPLPQAAAADLPPGNYGYFVYGNDVVITNLDNREIVDVLNGAA